MSWRETLGVTALIETPCTHNSQNAQKSSESGNCADIANSAYRNQDQVCHVPSNADQVNHCKNGLREKEGVPGVDMSTDETEALARLIDLRNQRNAGIRPTLYNKPAFCRCCGPVWLWFSGDVLGCPWCWNRVANRPIPRPSSIQCRNCIHFKRIDHPHLGHCKQGQPENIAGLWDDDRHMCDQFTPSSNVIGDHHG